MITFYVQLDPDTGYVTSAPQTEPTDGLTEIYLLKQSEQSFLKQWSHYYQDKTTGVIKPDQSGMMDISYDFLLHANQELQATWIQTNKDLESAQSDADAAKTDAATAKESLTKANATIESLQQMAGQLTAQSVTYQSTIKDLQSLAGQLTAQIVQLQAAGATDTTKE